MLTNPCYNIHCEPAGPKARNQTLDPEEPQMSATNIKWCYDHDTRTLEVDIYTSDGYLVDHSVIQGDKAEQLLELLRAQTQNQNQT